MMALTTTGEALDYRETTEALTAAMQAVTNDEMELASDTAAALARAGLVLVRIKPDAGLARQGHEGAADWFSRRDDT